MVSRGKAIQIVNEIVEHFLIPISILYKLIREGAIPAKVLWKQWCYNETEIDVWIKVNLTEKQMKKE